jgi:hypothetical protein
LRLEIGFFGAPVGVMAQSHRDKFVFLSLLWQVFLMEKKDLLVEIKEKSTAVIIKEFTSTGAKIQYNSMGEVKGKYSGSHIETVDVFQKMDGTNEWEVRAIETTKDGDTIKLMGKGTGRQEMGSTTGIFSGECTCMTMSPKLSWLNNTKVRIEGSTDLKSGEANIKVYSMK